MVGVDASGTGPGPTLTGARPKVIAHRGASFAEPEHTLRAYQRAIAVGADGVECDVRLTADRHLVCVHDRRANRTSSGRGTISSLELATLQELDWGSWKQRHGNDDAQRLEPMGAQVLTLRTLITTVMAARRPLDLVIETKHPTRYAGEVERRLVQTLGEYGLLDGSGGQVTPRLMSFSAIALQRLGRLAPRLERVLLVEVAPPAIYGGRLPSNVGIVGPRMGTIRRNPGFVAKHHHRGHQVHVWTVDDHADIDLCLRLGVDAIISNRPARVRAAVDAAYPRSVT